MHAAWVEGRRAAAATRNASRTGHDGHDGQGRPDAAEREQVTQSLKPVQPGSGEHGTTGQETGQETEGNEQGKEREATAGTATDSSTDSGTDSSTDGTTTEVKGMTGMGALGMTGELETTEELRAEVGAAQGLLDEAADAVAQLVAWASTLPDRMDAAPWETSAVLARVGEIAETLGTLQALEEAGESLTAMTPALDEADALGEHAAGVGAGGDVTAFQQA